MNFFYVGQRVRMVACDNPALDRLIGSEATIIGRPGDWILGEWSVRVDGELFEKFCESHHMAPIQPEGLESNEEIDALYEPSPCEAFENIGMRRESLP